MRFQLNNFSNTKGTGVFLKVSSRRSIASSGCIALLRCTRDVKPLLWGLNVVDASLRGEIQLLWARLGTEANFMLVRHSSRNFNFPAHGYLNFWKLVPLNSCSPGPKSRSNAPPKVIFLKKKIQRPWLSIRPHFKTQDLVHLFFWVIRSRKGSLHIFTFWDKTRCIPLERFDISGSHFRGLPIEVGCLLLHMKSHFEHVRVRNRYLLLKWDAKHDIH